MNKYNKLTLILLALITISIIPSAIVLVAETPCNEELKALGIEGPYTYDISSINRVIDVSSKAVKEDTRSYIVMNLDEYNGRISIPGHPALPYKSYKIILNGKYEVSDVSVLVVKYHEEILSKKIMPAPEPIPYMITSKSKNVELKEDQEIYSSSKFYPGKLVDYYVGYGLGGKTVIIVKFYPIQYNPVVGKIIVIDKAYITIKYDLEEYTTEPPESMVIITSKDLIDTLKPLVEFYNETGITVNITTIEYINKTFKPAENITMYSGFYNPMIKGEKDPIYPILVKTYKWKLALKTISFLRNVTGKYKYVLLVGDGNTVPPSFYYQSVMAYYYVGPWNAWNPTDFFYASPDYDLVPDYFVGRIPFSDPKLLSFVVAKIIDWYNVKDKGRNIAISGGAPFHIPLMFSETAIATETLKGITSMFNTTILTITSLNYDRNTVQNILQKGGYLWYYLICHGSGNALIDYMPTPEGYLASQILASTRDLAMMGRNSFVPVLTSVACMNAAWDDEVVPPWYFSPPCFGEAVLLSPAAGIAYVGSARIAWELGILFHLENGFATVEFYGAAYLHFKLLQAYNEFMGKRDKVGLGEVVAYGIVDFMTDVFKSKEAMRYMDLVLLTMFQLTLLGDPALQLPVFKDEYVKTNIKIIEPKKPDSILDIRKIAPIEEYKGTIPFYNPLRNATLTVYGVDGKIIVTLSRVVPGYMWYYLYRVKPGITFIKGEIKNGVCDIIYPFSKEVSGLVLTKVIVPGRCEARLFLISFGVFVRTPTAVAGGPVVIEGYGLDVALSGARSADLMVAGRIVTKVAISPEGYFNWTLALPYLVPGTYDIALIPPEYMYERMPEEFLQLLKGYVKVTGIEEIKVLISIGSIYEPETPVKARIVTLIKGEPKDAKLQVKLITPKEVVDLNAMHVGVGEYEVEFKAPETPGTYVIVAIAEYEDALIKARGFSTASFIVTTRFYDLQEIMKLGLEKLSDMMVSSSSDIKTAISETASLLNKSLSDLVSAGFIKITKLVEGTKGEIIAQIKVFNETVYARLSDLNAEIVKVGENTVKIITELGTIEGVIKEIKDGVATIETTLGEVKVSVSDIKTTVEGVKEDIPKLHGETMSKLDELAKSVSNASEKADKALKGVDELRQTTTILLGLIIVAIGVTGALGAITIKKITGQKAK